MIIQIKLELRVTFSNPFRKVLLSNKNKTPKKIPTQVLIWNIAGKVVRNLRIQIKLARLVWRNYKISTYLTARKHNF